MVSFSAVCVGGGDRYQFPSNWLGVVHNYQHLLKRTESTLGGGGMGPPYAFPPKIKIYF